MQIYLDNGSTSYPKPKEVAQSIYDFMINNGTTSGRGSYKNAMKSDLYIYETRKLICGLFKSEDPKKVIFTSNVTESINIAIRGILEKNDHVITSSLEHNAVWRTLKTLESERNIKITKVQANKEGYTSVSDIKKEIRENTKMLIFTHASNVLGTIQPIEEIGKIAKENNIIFLVDTAQTAGVIDIDINRCNIDLLAFTGHKSLLGPMGTGGLVVNCDYDIKPFKTGGTGGDSAYEYQPDYYPNKLETGTLNVCGLIGLREALKFIKKETLKNIYEKEKILVQYTLDRLNEVDNIIVYGPKNSEDRVGVIAFNIDNIKAEDLVYKLDSKYNIMARAGLHCAPNAHEIMGTKEIGSARIGIGYYNEKEEIDKLIIALNEIQR